MSAQVSRDAFATSDLTIRIFTERLSDGSTVHNVALKYSDCGPPIEIPAVTMRDAIALAEKIQAAIDEHTLFTAEIRDTTHA